MTFSSQSFHVILWIVLIQIGLGLATNCFGQAPSGSAERVTVTGEPLPSPTPHDDWKIKRDHLMPEVTGTQITVTKKATVIKLDQQPPVENNNQQELFTKAPGLLITEQHTPGQFNFSYRGLGNPQESEFIMVMRDGIPLMSEWIGFPTLYYLPLPQSVSEIQLIRGGSSLLYGPEPAPAINYVTKHPEVGTPWSAYLEALGGAHGYYSTYGSVQDGSGPTEVRVATGYDHSDGQRRNSWYDLWQADGYLGYRPDENQLWAVDFYASRFDGGDPGRLPNLHLFRQNENQTLTPYNEDWVDRYTTVLRHEHTFEGGWLLQAKAWYTHQEIDARAGANRNLTNGNFPTSTTFGYEEFNNGGVDVRLRHDWGDDTMFHGSAFTIGGVVYHGDAPFVRYTLNRANTGPGFLYAPRGSESDIRPLDQSRTADYQAFFFEDLIRLGKFHIVGSFRLDHENVEVDSTLAPWLPNPTLVPPNTNPPTGPASISAEHWVPLWGVGVGNDFGDRNETYFSATTGWRPTRFFDIAGTTRTIAFGADIPDPFHSLDLELGVHGTPFKGFWYDVGAFWMEFDNRTESMNVDAQGNPSNTDFVIENTGSTRHRGFEGEVYYDFLARFQHPPVPERSPEPSKDSADTKAPSVPGVSLADYHPFKFMLFSNAQYLDAEFTESDLDQPPALNKTLVGNKPAFAPAFLWKGGVSFQKEKCFNLTFSAVYVSYQYWQDTNVPQPASGLPSVLIPARIPTYKVYNLSGSFYITRNVRLIAGISNLSDHKYYNRIFANGIEPAPRRSGYGGLSIEF